METKEAAHISKALAWWYQRAIRLREALKQAYIDGGCREDEAEEMTRAILNNTQRDAYSE